MSEKEIWGTMTGVTNDGYPVVAEDYSYPCFTGTSRSVFTVQECWYYRHVDFRRSAKLHIHGNTCHCMENKVDARFGSMKNEE